MTQDDTTARLVADLLQQSMGRREVTHADYGADIKSFGIDGDDAEDFMRAYRTRFAVNLAEFSFSSYFSSEGFSPTVWLLDALGIWPRQAALSIHDLAAAADRGHWPARSPQMLADDRRRAVLSKLALGIDIAFLLAIALAVRTAVRR